MFGHFIDSLDNSDIKLGDLIESVDNRGKTPPLSDEPTDYPIIDVRALSGNSRIIDYKGDSIAEIKDQKEGVMSATLNFVPMYDFRNKCTCINDIRETYEVKRV